MIKSGLVQICASLLFLLFSTSAHSAAKTILVLGDSLSSEYGLPRNSGWVSLLKIKLSEQNRNVHIINASAASETTRGGVSRLPALLAQHKPNIIILELGANDGLRGLPLETIENNLQSLLTLAKQHHARVLLIGMRLPPNYGRTYGEPFMALYAQLAKKNKTALVPFLMEGFASNPALFQEDQIHPNTSAQAMMLNTLWPVLLKLL